MRIFFFLFREATNLFLSDIFFSRLFNRTNLIVVVMEMIMMNRIRTRVTIIRFFLSKTDYPPLDLTVISCLSITHPTNNWRHPE